MPDIQKVKLTPVIYSVPIDTEELITVFNQIQALNETIATQTRDVQKINTSIQENKAMLANLNTQLISIYITQNKGNFPPSI